MENEAEEKPAPRESIAYSMIRTAHTYLSLRLFAWLFFYVWYYVMLFVSHEDKKNNKKKKFIKLKRMNGMGSVKIISLYNGYINIFFFFFSIIMNIFYNYIQTLIFVLCFFSHLLRRLLVSFFSFANQSIAEREESIGPRKALTRSKMPERQRESAPKPLLVCQKILSHFWIN